MENNHKQFFITNYVAKGSRYHKRRYKRQNALNKNNLLRERNYFNSLKRRKWWKVRRYCWNARSSALLLMVKKEDVLCNGCWWVYENVIVICPSIQFKGNVHSKNECVYLAFVQPWSTLVLLLNSGKWKASKLKEILCVIIPIIIYTVFHCGSSSSSSTFLFIQVHSSCRYLRLYK